MVDGEEREREREVNNEGSCVWVKRNEVSCCVMVNWVSRGVSCLSGLTNPQMACGRTDELILLVFFFLLVFVCRRACCLLSFSVLLLLLFWWDLKLQKKKKNNPQREKPDREKDFWKQKEEDQEEGGLRKQKRRRTENKKVKKKKCRSTPRKKHIHTHTCAAGQQGIVKGSEDEVHNLCQSK